jgi:hypothetical protein
VEIGVREEASESEREVVRDDLWKTASRIVFPSLVPEGSRWNVACLKACLCWGCDVDVMKIGREAVIVAIVSRIAVAAAL